MAEITYKLYDPKKKAYRKFADTGTDTKTTSASIEELEKYAIEKGLNLKIISGATPVTGQAAIVPRDELVAEATPLGAIGGGLLSGATLGFRDELFGKDEETGEYPQDIEKEAWPRLYEGARMVGSLIPDIGLSVLGAAATRGRVSPAAIATAVGGLTGAAEAIGEAPAGEKLTPETAAEAAAGAVGGATGGYVGEKVISPLLKRAGKALVQKFKSNVPKFAGEVTEQTREGGMEVLNKEAQALMMEKEAAEAALQKQLARKSELKSESDILEAQRRKMLEGSEDSRAIELLDPEAREELAPELPEFTKRQMREIMKKPVDQLTGEELFQRISVVGAQYAGNFQKIKALEDAITNSNLGIEQKKAGYARLKRILEQHADVEDYVKRFKSSALGGAVGAEVGAEVGKASVRPAGIRKGSI